MTNYLIPSGSKDFYLNKLLQESGQNYLVGATFKTIKQLLDEFISLPTIYDFYDSLINYPANKFAPLYNDIGFLKEIFSLREYLDQYQVPLSDINVDEDLRFLLSKLPVFPFADFYLQVNDLDFSNYQIFEGCYSFFEEHIIKLLLKNGAKLMPAFKNKEHSSFKTLVKNEGEGIEAVLQYIIKNDLKLEDVAIILCDNKQKLLTSLLNNYQMPFFNKIGDKHNQLALALARLLDFYLEPNLNNYLRIAKQQIFTTNNDALNVYLQRHFNHQDSLFSPFNKFQDEDKYYQYLEKKAENARKIISDKLTPLLSIKDFKEAVVYLFNLIKSNDHETLELKSLIEKNALYLSKEHYFIFKDLLMRLLTKDKINNGIEITSLLKGSNRPYLFVLNASQEHFPHFKTLSGLANEKTFANTTFPTIKERYEHHFKLLEYLDNSKQTIYLCPTTSYSGKAIELSSSLENLKDIDIKPICVQSTIKNKHHLSHKLAPLAFFDEGVLKSSISALEKYMQCHYAYFLNYVLKLYEPRTFDIDAATVGTIVHAIFEDSINKYQKKYPYMNDEELAVVASPYFKRLEKLYPNDLKAIKLCQDKVLKAIRIEFDYLQKLEDNTDFKPLNLEYEFNIDFINKADAKVFLRGFIDRVDYAEDYFRIIDYKTSIHSLSKSDIACGLKLQLMTYLLVFAKLSGRKPVGAYYLNVNMPRFKFDDYSYSIKNGLEDVENDMDSSFNKKHKLIGLSVNDYAGLDYGYKYLLNRGNKQISKDYLLNKKELREAFETIYTSIYQEMANGDIAINPIDGACKYCIYRNICHFKGGNFAKREELYTFDNNNKEASDES